MIPEYEMGAFLTKKKFDKAFLPHKLVAESLEIDPRTVINRMNKGELLGFKLDKKYYVYCNSFVETLEKLTAQHKFVADYIISKVETGITSVSYSEIMEPLQLDHSISSDRRTIANILARLSEASYEICNEEILMSVVVHNKGTILPSTGFFQLANSWGFETNDKEEFVKEQTKLLVKNIKNIKQNIYKYFSDNYYYEL